MRYKQVPPCLSLSTFNCTYCHAYAHQAWIQLSCFNKKNYDPPKVRGVSQLYIEEVNTHYKDAIVRNLNLSQCEACNKITVWHRDTIVYPASSNNFTPHPDLPEHALIDYVEAASIFNASPRGAAALLRLTIQKLCLHLGLKGKNINDDISTLVKRGLDEKIQKALDIVRVTGNEAVHPGTMDLNDDKEIAAQLFGLVNFIVEELITRPKRIENMYQSIPQTARDQIEKRDGQKFKS